VLIRFMTIRYQGMFGRLMQEAGAAWLALAPLVLALVLLLASAVPARAQDASASVQASAVPAPDDAAPWRDRLVPGRQWVDPDGRADIARAIERFAAGEDRPFDPHSVLPLGEGAAVWVRLDLPAVNQPRSVVLSIPHPGMDNIELYRLGPDGRWRMERTGDATPVAQWPVRDRVPAFEFTLQPGETAASWLRVQHSHPIGVRWGLWDSRSFDESSKRWHLVLGGYAGFLVLVVVLSLFNAVSWRDPIHLYYAGYVTVLGLAQLSQVGVAGEFFWPRNAWWNDIGSVVLPILALVSAILFIGELVAERGQRWLSWVNVVTVTAGLAIALGFVMLGRGPVFAVSNLYYLLCFVFYIGVVGWFTWRRPRVGLWVLAGLVTIMGGATFAILRNMGLLPLSFATQYGAQIGVALEIPLVLIGLYFRSRERRDSQVRLSALVRVDPLTGVGSHRVMMERLEHLIERHRRDPSRGAVMRVRLANVAEIRREHGLEVAQAALVKAGTIVARTGAEGDTIARHRDGDFIVQLEGRMHRDEVAEAGRNIIARGLAYSQRLPRGLTLTLHVACACAPLPDGLSGQELLAALDSLLDDIQRNPGRAMRFLGDPASQPGRV
jgi:GGDEF domain-containing protein